MGKENKYLQLQDTKYPKDRGKGGVTYNMDDFFNKLRLTQLFMERVKVHLQEVYYIENGIDYVENKIAMPVHLYSSEIRKKLIYEKINYTMNRMKDNIANLKSQLNKLLVNKEICDNVLIQAKMDLHDIDYFILNASTKGKELWKDGKLTIRSANIMELEITWSVVQEDIVMQGKPETKILSVNYETYGSLQNLEECKNLILDKPRQVPVFEVPLFEFDPQYYWDYSVDLHSSLEQSPHDYLLYEYESSPQLNTED